MSCKNQIRMASLLLGMLMLLASCSPETKTPNAEDVHTNDLPSVEDTEKEEETEEEPGDSLIGPVEPVLKNFFTFKSVTPWKTLTSAQRLNGALWDSSADHGVIVLRESIVDLKNRATETYTVYNTALGKTVLTVSNSYTYRNDYTAFDWNGLCVTDPSVRYPEQVTDVLVLNERGYDLIEVRRAKIKEIPDAEEGKDRYIIETAYEYYDVAGQKLVESKNAASVRVQSISNGYAVLNVADVSVLLDTKTGLAQSLIKADGEAVRFGYSDQTEQYGYYLKQNQAAPNGSSRSFLEVYDRGTHTRVLRYYPDECDYYFVYVMQNGDMFIQYLNRVEAESGIAYDLILNGNNYTLKTCIVDVPSGKVTSIACPYLILTMNDRAEFSELNDMESKRIHVTENAVNICAGIPIANKVLEFAEQKIIVLNNDGSLLYEMQPIIPEHSIRGGLGFTISAKGDYVVDLDGVLDADRAIISADMRVRAYLRPEAEVVGEYVLLPEGIYDYDMNVMYRFEEQGFRLERIIGNRLLVSKIDEAIGAGGSRVYWEIFRQDDQFEARMLFDGQTVILTELEEDYLIVKHPETGKYSLYNVNLTHVLTTQSEMRVSCLENRYLVATEVSTDEGTIPVFYTLGE